MEIRKLPPCLALGIASAASGCDAFHRTSLQVELQSGSDAAPWSDLRVDSRWFHMTPSTYSVLQSTSPEEVKSRSSRAPDSAWGRSKTQPPGVPVDAAGCARIEYDYRVDPFWEMLGREGDSLDGMWIEVLRQPGQSWIPQEFLLYLDDGKVGVRRVIRGPRESEMGPLLGVPERIRSLAADGPRSDGALHETWRVPLPLSPWERR